MHAKERFCAVLSSMRRWLDDAVHEFSGPVGANNRFPGGLNNRRAVIPPSWFAVQHVFAPGKVCELFKN